MLKQVFIAVVAGLSVAELPAQPPSALNGFYGIQVKDHVLLQFTLKSGISCNGVGIQRSDDSITFYSIGDIQGICGSPNFETDFEFTDPFPRPNEVNHYRLDLGNYGYSEVVSVSFRKLNAVGYALSANPCTPPCLLYFENPQDREVRVRLYHAGGQLLLDERTRGTSFEIVPAWLPAGTFCYHLWRDDERLASGTIVVIH